MDDQQLNKVQSSTSVRYISRFASVPYLKPINISTPSHFHHSSRRNSLSHSSHKKVSESRQKGIIFEWPQRRKSFTEKELGFLAWLIAHVLFWLHIAHLLPTGTALELNQPPWRYRPPLPKPENRDYIIEPDWDSGYT